MEHIRMYLLIFWSFYLGGCLCTIQISKDKCGFSGDSVTLSCTIAAADFLQPFIWRNDKISGDISVCGPSSCTPPSESRYSASANATAISLTITNLIRSDDETNWNCLLQGSGSPTTISLSVRDYPSSCALRKSDDDYMCETGCGYPKSDLTIDWFLSTSSGLKDLTNPMKTTSTAGCSTGGKASATFKESDITEDGTLYCRCGMQIACPEKVEIVSNNITITKPTTKPATTTTETIPSETSDTITIIIGVCAGVVGCFAIIVVYFVIRHRKKRNNAAGLENSASDGKTMNPPGKGMNITGNQAYNNNAYQNTQEQGMSNEGGNGTNEDGTEGHSETVKSQEITTTTTPNNTTTEITTTTTPNNTTTGGKSDVSLGLLITDIILFVIYMPLYWFVVVTTKDKDKIWGMEYSNVAAIIITVIGVISVILCGVGYGISDTQKSTGEALSIVGFVIGVLMLIATIFIVIQAKFTVINKKKCDEPRAGPEGQEGKRKPVDPKPRNEATVLSTRSIGHTRKKRRNRNRVTESPTSTSKIKTKFRNNQVSDSNESDVDTTTPRGMSALDSVPPGRKLPPINISSVPNVPEEPEKVKKKKKKVKKSYKDDKQEKGPKDSDTNRSEQKPSTSVVNGDTQSDPEASDASHTEHKPSISVVNGDTQSDPKASDASHNHQQEASASQGN